MVVYHIKDDGNACLMEGLHHLLELLDTDSGVVGIGGIASLGYVVVHWVVAPVVLVVAETGLIHRTIVVAGQDMHSVDTQLLKVVEGPRLGECEELAWILGIRTGDGEVTMVELIDDEVSWRLHHRATVVVPIGWRRLRHINNGSTLTIDSHGFGKDTRTLATTHIEGVETSHEVTLHSGCPQPVGISHLDGLQGLASHTVLIDSHYHFLCRCGGKKAEGRSLWTVGHLVEGEVLGGGYYGNQHKQ